ncbi:BA75_00126T0 [Komagataella pastoris]|uniref:BA75_00126T0 n=1 Tax=Komagataella pastoris TaxID=4922 RepID=A0A1B2J5K7_PICPA|nr:BA75_00126T0 [Komagataella pastoris]
MNDSNPGTHAQSIGGVGFNVALATHMASRDHGSVVETRLCSAVGNDLLGKGLMETMKSFGMETDAVSISENFPTGTYVSIHDRSGALVVASADMKVVENISIEHIMKCLEKYQPSWVLLDCNLSSSLIDAIVKLEDFDVVLEPTSAIKAAKLAKLNNLRIFPHNSVKLITPTVTELNAIFDEFYNNSLFDTYHNEWFPVVDSLGLDYNARHSLDRQFERSDFLKPLLEQGLLTKTFRLLPFFNNIIVKDGKNGIIVFQIITDCDKYDHLIRGSKIIGSASTFSFMTKGKRIRDGRIGVLVQHFPVVDVVPSDEIVNVTGAGDSLLGYLFSKLSTSSSWLTKLDSTRETYLINSMKSSATSLKSDQAINIEQIKQIP